MKGYVRCMWQPKGCMVERYTMEVSMGFLIEYIQDFQAMAWRVWDVEEEEDVSGRSWKGLALKLIYTLKSEIWLIIMS